MAKMYTLNANSDVALESELAAKADEFAPWVITGSQSSGASVKWLPDDEVWGLFFGGTTNNFAPKNRFATEILPSDWDTPIDITATRKRVLRSGDADKLTDAQKAVLAGGPYVPMSVGDVEAYKTARIQAASLARLLIDSGLEAAIELSSGDETIRLAVTMSSGASIKKNGKEVATEDQLRVTMQLVGNDPYTVQLDGETLTFAQIKELAQTCNAVIQRGQGTYRVTYIGSTEMMWDVTGSVAGNVQTGQIHIFDQNYVTVVQRVEPKVLATKPMVDAVSDKVDGIKETVSTDNRLLVNGTTAAIQTRTDETAEWTDEIRVDKGYDAVQGDEMVKLDKSVQNITVASESLSIVLPEETRGTVRDLCLYVNNNSGEDCALVFPAGTYYGDNPNGAVAKDGGVTAVYITEMPVGSWMLRISELEQFTVEATT